MSSKKDVKKNTGIVAEITHVNGDNYDLKFAGDHGKYNGTLSLSGTEIFLEGPTASYPADLISAYKAAVTEMKPLETARIKREKAEREAAEKEEREKAEKASKLKIDNDSHSTKKVDNFPKALTE